MNQIKYKGIENCFTCIGESNEWTLIEYPELSLLKFYENTSESEAKALLLDSVEDNIFYFHEVEGHICIKYREDSLKSERYEAMSIEKTNEQIIFTSDNRQIEFTRK